MFESGATEFHAVTAPLHLETKRLRQLSPGALADEALALKKRIDAIKDEAIRRRLKTAEGEAGRITLSPPGSQDRTERELLLKALDITEAEFIAHFTRAAGQLESLASPASRRTVATNSVRSADLTT